MKGLLVYLGILLGIIVLIVGSMISYMSLNNWDIRCILVECKPVQVIGG